MLRFAILPFVILASPAHAVCALNQEVIFQCLDGAKTIELCLTPSDQNVTYRFGAASAPEIELTRGFDEIEMVPWNGIGRSIWDQVTVSNGNFAYGLFWNYDKFDETASGGLQVTRGESVVARRACTAEGIYNFDILRIAMQEAGYCRSDTNAPLTMGPCS
ncbi:hypothetical protein [Celeribacter arenosi]|uniref:Uncharacterized protein n=1 Tax=Celeribacter arenosi TaxID=792649 RepID=A0ABP7JU02_9RHOB